MWPYDDFRKELLVKENSFDITKVVEGRREYEAILASQKSLSSKSFVTLSYFLDKLLEVIGQCDCELYMCHQYKLTMAYSIRIRRN